MKKKAYRQNAFNAGELSPRLKGRADLEKYKTGLQECQNMLPLPHGPISKRPGFRYINSVKTASEMVEIVPFEFSETESYILEFGDLYMRVYMDGGRVVAPDSNTKLLLHMDGVDGGITFTDDGTNSHTVSANGNAQTDTGQYYFATASGTFDGVGDYLSIADHADWNFGSSGMTIDFWVRFNSVTGTHTFYYQDDTTAGDIVWFYIDHTKNTLNFRVVDGGTLIINITETWNPTVDTWYHVALIRGWGSQANDWAMCVDGTILNTATTDAGTLPDHDQQVEIGGLSAANMFLDFSNSCHVLSVTNDTTIYTATQKWGDACVLFDGTGDDLNTPDHADWDVLSQTNATIDLWIYHGDHVGTEAYIGQYEDANNFWAVAHTHGSGLQFFVKSAASTIIDTGYGGEITDVAWHHVAACKVGSYYACYLDGVQVNYTKDTDSDTFAGKLELGAQNAGASSAFYGCMNDVRLTHANDFSADPSKPFKDSGNTDHGDVSITGGLTMDATTYKWGSGSWAFNGTDAYGSFANHADFNLAGQTNFTIDLWVKHTDHAGNEVYWDHSVDGTHYTFMRHVHGSGVQVQWYNTSLIFQITGAEITDTSWHHIAFIKVGTDWGIYVDGTQSAYVSSATTYNPAGSFDIGGSSVIGQYFDGNIDEFRLTHANDFSAAPVAGLTDTITVPTGAHSSDANCKLLLHADVDTITVPTAPHTPDSNTKFLLYVDLYGFDGWLDEYRASNTTRWTANFTPPSVEYPGGGGSADYELVTPYDTDDDISLLRVLQATDTLYIAHPRYNVRKLTRTDHDNWTITDIDWAEPPWNDVNETAITLDPSDVTGNITVVASAAFFSPLHVGAYFKQAGGYYKITAVTDSTNANATVKSNLTDHVATATWYQGCWDDTQSYPSMLTFYEDRLVAIGDASHPLRVFLSETGDYEDFGDDSGGVAADPLEMDLWSQQLNATKWCVAGKKLFIGTVGSEFWATGETEDKPITPTSILVRKETTRGGKGIQPMQIGHSIVFVQKDGKRLREFYFWSDDDGYIAIDLNILSEHMCSGTTIKKIQYAQDPHSVLWIILSNGDLWSMTYVKEHKVIGFAQHISNDSTGACNFESIAVIPGNPTEPFNGDEVWVATQRTVNGSTVRYLERLDEDFFNGSITDDAFFVDSGLSSLNNVSPAGTFGGLSHLEGETVQVLADGVYHGDYTVSGGQFTLTGGATATDVHAGLGYNADAKTLIPDAEGEQSEGSELKRIYALAYGLYETGTGCKIGRDSSSLNDITGLTSGSLNTDTYKQQFNGEFSLFPSVYIRQGAPLPFTLIAIMYEIEMEDD